MVFARGDFRFAHLSAIRERQGGGAGYTDDYTIRRNVPVIAVLPNVPDCQSAIAAGQARAVFADEGPPYTLISGDDRCEVLGLVLVFQTKDALMGGQVEPTR